MQVLEAQNIRYVFVIGGNDTMDTADNIGKLAEGRYDVAVMGIPKTVDNDLPITDHTPGFASAAKYMAIATMEAGRDTEAIAISETVTIVECMGRDTGWLTAATGVASRCDTRNRRLYVFLHQYYISDVPDWYVMLVVRMQSECVHCSGLNVEFVKSSSPTLTSGFR